MCEIIERTHEGVARVHAHLVGSLRRDVKFASMSSNNYSQHHHYQSVSAADVRARDKEHAVRLHLPKLVLYGVSHRWGGGEVNMEGHRCTDDACVVVTGPEWRM